MSEQIEIHLPTFYPAQVAAFKLWQKNRFVVGRCGRRWGKALALDTAIPTPSGWTTMGALQVGDSVFDERGAVCRITGATEVQVGRPCNRVVFSDGSELVADDDHKWLTWDRCARKNAARNSKAKSQKKNYIKPIINGYPKVRTTAEIRSSLTSGLCGETNHSIPVCGPVAYPHRELTIPPYILGAWLGDGVSASARIACDDQAILDEIRREGQEICFTNDKFMYHLGYPKGKTPKDSISLKTRLADIEVIKNKHIPTLYLHADVEQRMSLLQGMMDTDGYVCEKGHCEFTSIRKVLAYSALELCLSLGIRAYLFTGEATLNGKNCGIKYRVKFTTDLPVFRLPRKMNRLRARKPSNYTKHRYIVDVLPEPSVPVRCISVDSPSHLYLAGRSFIATHNTDFGKVIAVDGAAKGQKIGWFAPNYKIQTEAYAEIAAALRPIKTESSETKGLIRTTAGGRIDFWTTNDPMAGRSRHYHKVIMDEAAFMKENAIDIWNQAIEPTLYDYTGKVLVISNTNGVSPSNFLHMLCEPDATRAPGVPGPERGFVEFHGTIYDNPHLPKRRPGESDADHAIRRAENIEALRKTKHPLVWRQEYLAEFVDFSGDAFFLEEYILLDGKAVPYPRGCDFVYAIIDTAVKSGKEHDGLAVTFFALDMYSGKPPITILDWDISNLEGSLLEAWMPGVFRRLEELAKQCGARMGSLGAWIEDKVSGTILLQQGRRKGWAVHEIDSPLTAVGKDERAVSVSDYVVSGKVKISEFAFEKVTTYKETSRNHFRAQVLGFRVGAKGNQADDLLDCFCYGIAIGFGNQDGY